MLYFDKIEVSEGIDVTKTSELFFLEKYLLLKDKSSTEYFK